MTGAPNLIDAFLLDVPGAESTQARRRKQLWAALEAAGFEITRPETKTILRVGEGFGTLSETLAALPVDRFPSGVRGRRDGWLLVLVGVMGLSRRQAVTVSSADVVLFPELRVRGRSVPKELSSRECPACAVFRWLRIVWWAGRADKLDVREILSFGSQGEHDCASGLDGAWRDAETLAPSIDVAGRINSFQPLTVLSVTNVVKFRQTMAVKPQEQTSSPNRGSFRRLSMGELTAAQDDADNRAAELLLRIADILGDGQSLLGRVSDLGVPVDLDFDD